MIIAYQLILSGKEWRALQQNGLAYGLARWRHFVFRLVLVREEERHGLWHVETYLRCREESR